MLQPRLTSVSAQENYRLLLEYETGEVKVFDTTPYLSGSWYAKLKEQAYFRAVRMLPDGTGIECPEGQDIAPHELYEFSVAV